MNHQDIKKLESSIKIEDQYRLYLHLVKLDESRMSHEQRIETRQAFFAAWGQLLYLLRDLMRVSDDAFDDALTSMFSELEVYWKTRNNKAGYK